MKNKKGIISFILVFSLVLLAVFTVMAFANNEEEETMTPVSAEIMNAPNGATGIATMTFADGIWDVAVIVNELCEEYGFRASLMFNQDLGGKTAAEWNNLLAEGNLDPESHSLTHKNFENVQLTPEQYAAEIGGSYTFLKECFPAYDILAFAAPSMSYTASDLEEVNKYFYAARNGQCVLYIPGNRGKMQSVDPPVGTTPGSWMNMYQVRVQPNVELYSQSNSVEKIIGYLDTCVANGGWFTSLTHTIGDNGDVTLAQLREILDAMKAYQDEGKLWVASYTEAAKYVRERQNSTVSAYEKSGVCYVGITMKETTADNLPLTSDIFNMPLTVKLEVPASWTKVSYTLNGDVKTVFTRGNDAGRYAYINVVPNSGDVAVYNATPENDQTVVGTYTQPEGTWRPAEGSGIKFAEWASEESFLRGDEPIATYTENELSHENVGLPAGDTSVKNNYVHLFADCTTLANGQLVTGRNQTMVINLGGFALDSPNGIRPGDASGVVTTAKLTIKNGTFNHHSGNVQCRANSELRYDNVVYNVGGACMNYDGGAKLVEFKNSTVNITGYAHFTVSMDAEPCIYTFINTDIITTNSQAYLFRVNVNGNYMQYPELNIRFDKDSSIIRDARAPLICINRGFVSTTEDVPLYLTRPVNLILEEGCVLSENIAPIYGKGYFYMVEHYNQSSGKYGPTGTQTAESRYTVSFDGGFANQDLCVKVVKPGTDEMIEWNNVKIDDGIIVLEKKATTAWAPGADYAGITFGVWNSEADYLAGKAPVAWSKALTFTTADVANAGYMRFYADLSDAEGQIATDDKQSLVIDLAGFTFTNGYGLRPGGTSGSHPNSYLTVKNGTVIHTTLGSSTSQYQFRADTKVIFDKVLFIQQGGSFYGCAPDLWRFKDSTLYMLNPTSISLGASYTSNGYKVSLISFENTDIFYRTETTAPLFTFTESNYGDCVYNLVFDKNSSMNVKYSGGFAKLEEAYKEGKVYNTFKVRVIMEDGFTVYENSKPTFEYIYTPINTETGKAGDSVTHESSTDPNAVFSWVIAEPTTHENAKTTYYELDGSDLRYNKSKRLIANLGSFYQFVELDSEGKILNTWPVGSSLGTEEKGAFTNVNGSTIKFFHDTEVKNPSTLSSNNVTFDLNGCTLTKTGSSAFQLGYSMSGQWKERVVKFINTNPDKRGVLDFDNMANVIQNRPGSIVVFENIDIWSVTALFTEYGAKSITFTNVNFYSNTGSVVIGGGFDVKMVGNYCAGGGVREFVFDNCTFNKVSPISWSHADVEDNVRVIFKSGTTFTAGYSPINISGSGVKNLEVVIEDGVRLPDYRTPFVSQSGTASATVTGDKASAFTVLDGYYVTASIPNSVKGDNLQANLTLYTDLQLNIFANPGAVTSITKDGSALEKIDYNGKEKYTVKGITPDTAADAINLIIYVTEGESDYIIPVSYSILTYSERVIAFGDDENAKKLVSSVMAYVKAAYAYAGKDAPAFEGVAFDSFTVSAKEATVPAAIKGAQLDLASGFKLRFNIAEGYEGTIVVNGTSYEVVNGAYNGITYFEVNMRAYALYNTPVVITADGVTGEYSLANYVAFANVSGNAKLATLANALYDYAAYANAYKAAN